MQSTSVTYRIRCSLAAFLLTALALLVACSTGQPPPPAAESEPPAISRPLPGSIYRETGIAAWFGEDLHGKRAADGGVFDMFGLSAIHRTLPLGTDIRVTNLDNLKSATVRIVDRGPFIRKRVLDLSYGAARELDFIAQGTARVLIEVLEGKPDPGQYTVLAAVYTEEESARLLKERLNRKYEVVVIVPFETNVSKFYRVRVGAYGSEEKAEQIASKLTLEGLEPVVLRKD